MWGLINVGFHYVVLTWDLINVGLSNAVSNVGLINVGNIQQRVAVPLSSRGSGLGGMIKIIVTALVVRVVDLIRLYVIGILLTILALFLMPSCIISTWLLKLVQICRSKDFRSAFTELAGIRALVPPQHSSDGMNGKYYSKHLEGSCLYFGDDRVRDCFVCH